MRFREENVFLQSSELKESHRLLWKGTRVMLNSGSAYKNTSSQHDSVSVHTGRLGPQVANVSLKSTAKQPLVSSVNFHLMT